MARDIDVGLQAGFVDYLTKPVKIDRLMAALDAARKSTPTQSGRAAAKEPK